MSVRSHHSHHSGVSGLSKHSGSGSVMSSSQLATLNGQPGVGGGGGNGGRGSVVANPIDVLRSTSKALHSVGVEKRPDDATHLQMAINWAMDILVQKRPPDPVTFLANKLLEYHRVVINTRTTDGYQVFVTHDAGEPAQGLAEIDVRFHLQLVSNCDWGGAITTQSLSSTDGRWDAHIASSPGGDFGEFLSGLAVYEMARDKLLTQDEIDTLLLSFLESTPRPSFHLQISKLAMDNLANDLRSVITGQLDLQTPPEYLKALLLRRLIVKENIGCDFLRCRLDGMTGAAPLIRPDLIPMLLKSFFSTWWKSSPRVKAKMKLDVVDGEHNEKAVLHIRSCVDPDGVERTLLLNPLKPEDKSSYLLLNHVDAATAFRAELASFFADWLHSTAAATLTRGGMGSSIAASVSRHPASDPSLGGSIVSSGLGGREKSLAPRVIDQEVSPAGKARHAPDPDQMSVRSGTRVPGSVRLESLKDMAGINSSFSLNHNSSFGSGGGHIAHDMASLSRHSVHMDSVSVSGHSVARDDGEGEGGVAIDRGTGSPVFEDEADGNSPESFLSLLEALGRRNLQDLIKYLGLPATLPEYTVSFALPK